MVEQDGVELHQLQAAGGGSEVGTVGEVSEGRQARKCLKKKVGGGVGAIPLPRFFCEKLDFCFVITVHFNMNNNFFTRLGSVADVKRAQKGLKSVGAEITKNELVVEAKLNGNLIFAAAKVNSVLWACRYNREFYS